MIDAGGWVSFGDSRQTGLEGPGIMGGRTNDIWLHLRTMPTAVGLTYAGVRMKGGGDTLCSHLATLTSLRCAYLGNMGLTDRGMLQLASLRQLRILYVDDNEITDAGLRVVEEMPELEVLGISNTLVSAQGLKRLQQCKMLSHLIIGSETLRGLDVEEVRRALPRCVIEGPE